VSTPKFRAPKVLHERERCRRLDGGTKASYRSRAKARQAIRDHRPDPNRPKLYVYECRHCGLWHLTSQPPRA
jgi:hypothetical protein